MASDTHREYRLYRSPLDRRWLLVAHDCAVGARESTTLNAPYGGEWSESEAAMALEEARTLTGVPLTWESDRGSGIGPNKQRGAYVARTGRAPVDVSPDQRQVITSDGERVELTDQQIERLYAAVLAERVGGTT